MTAYDFTELDSLIALESRTLEQQGRLDELCRMANEEGEREEEERAHDPSAGLREFFGTPDESWIA